MTTLHYCPTIHFNKMFGKTLLLSLLASTAFSIPTSSPSTDASTPNLDQILAAAPSDYSSSDPLNIRDMFLNKRGQSTIRQGTTFPFADASIFRWGPSFWWAFATPSVNQPNMHVQIATSPDFTTWTSQTYDAMPATPPWADQTSPEVWAPNVVFISSTNSYVLYFSAAMGTDPSLHCIGAATSDNVQGPYQPLQNPLYCPLSQGGAIDPSGFNDPATGHRYVVYKIDGNSLGKGGACGNTIAPIIPTPIMIQEVSSTDGVTPIGSAIQILDRSAADGPLIEAPALMRTADGRYVTFFSSNCYTTSYYDVSYAIANSATGPYTKYGPFAVTGTDGLFAPGGAHVAFDGQHIVFHAGVIGKRYMYTAELSIAADSNVMLGAGA